MSGEHGEQRKRWRILSNADRDVNTKTFLEERYPDLAAKLVDPVARREMLKLMGASVALAGLAPGCTNQPEEKILPYARRPETLIPGNARYFATAMPFDGASMGLLVESHENRPTKVEGNPKHPSSLGGTDVFAQASVLNLYDPDRAQGVTRGGHPASFTKFVADLNPVLERLKADQGEGMVILSDTVTSRSLADQRSSLLRSFPKATWHQWNPANFDNAHDGSVMAFGEALTAVPSVDKADVIVSFGAGLLDNGPGWVANASRFATRRRAGTAASKANRLYTVESAPSLTGAASDHRLAARPAAVVAIANALAAAVGHEGAKASPLDAAQKRWVEAVAKDLKGKRGRSLLVASRDQSAEVHALVHAMNIVLGNAGNTVRYVPWVAPVAESQGASLAALSKKLKGTPARLFVILGGNPAFDSPAEFGIDQAIRTAGLSVHLSSHANETTALSQWHIPESHFLEAWSDAVAHDGSAAIVQPLIAPLYSSKSAHEIISTLLGKPGTKGYEIVQSYWASVDSPATFATRWQRALHDGVIEGSTPQAIVPRLRRFPAKGASASSGDLDVVFLPDPTVWDGRFANNGWLQELPKVHTRLTWDNAIEMAPGDAKARGLENGDVVELSVAGQKVRGPIWRSPAMAAGCAVLRLGYGRTAGGDIAVGPGFNSYPARTSGGFWSAGGAQLSAKSGTYTLATTQDHPFMEGRTLVKTEHVGAKPAASAQGHGDHGHGDHGHGDHGHGDHGHGDHGHGGGHAGGHPSLLNPVIDYSKGYAWAMTIDLASCIGCNACTIACQAENNIAVVGKDQVKVGRELHWIRVDRYYSDETENAVTHHQPVPCMQCENAPCEYVCPVNATVHSDEGLNDMVYNRCVGTRYCANNCPYKVRRFNFLLYADFDTESLKLQRNPDVTTRSRGVMEKCTYCVQRIEAARIDSRVEGDTIKDGDVITACQQACPTQAISFGDMNDKDSKIYERRAQPTRYSLFEELNTTPRTTYLPEIRNRNPELSEV